MPRGDYPPEPLSHDDVRALLRACGGGSAVAMRNHALITVLWRCGLRIGEALALRPADIDWDAGTLRVRFGKGRKARTVGVDDGALAVLAAWDAARTAAGAGTGLLFCSVRGDKLGGPMAPRYVRAMMTRLGEKAGIGHRVHCHGLRHTHSVDLRKEGWPILEISRQLGHSSISTTQIYIDHLYPAEVVARGRAREWWSDTG